MRFAITIITVTVNASIFIFTNLIFILKLVTSINVFEK